MNIWAPGTCLFSQQGPQKQLNPPGKVRGAGQFSTVECSLLGDSARLTFPQAHKRFLASRFGLNSFKVQVLPESGYLWGL